MRMIAVVIDPGTNHDPDTTPSPKESEKVLRFRFVGLDCTACARIVEKRLEGKKGVKKVGVSLMTDSVLVKINPAEVREEEVELAIRRLGYKVVRTDSSFR